MMECAQARARWRPTRSSIIGREDDGGSIADQLETRRRHRQRDLVQRADPARRQRAARSSAANTRSRPASACARSRRTDRSHKVVLHKLTIPEGLTSEQIVERLRDDDFLVGDIKETAARGLAAARDLQFRARRHAARRCWRAWRRPRPRWSTRSGKARAPDLPIKSPDELVTLASIVEKETGKADERPRVAGVFVNRLQKHMRLQSDPTIVYGLVFGKGTLGHPITKAELDQPTPYNTYLIDGLPPGPIANPGKAALEAVANPARSEGPLFRRRRNRRPCLRRDARPAPQERRALAPDREGRQGPPGAGREPADAAPAPCTANSVRSIRPVRRAVPHRAGPDRRRPLSPSASPRSARAVKPWRARSPRSPAALRPARRSRTLGAVVAGVNDSPADGAAFSDADARRSTEAARGVRPAVAGDARRRKGARSEVRARRSADSRRRDGGRRPRRRGADRLGTTPHLRCVGRHEARSAAEQDLRPQLRQGGADVAVARPRGKGEVTGPVRRPFGRRSAPFGRRSACVQHAFSTCFSAEKRPSFPPVFIAISRA